jgi:CxxC-x17-CxxC domain-containing protein
MYDVICAECGTTTKVPFEPRESRPVYCNDCFSKVRLQVQSAVQIRG